MYYKGFYCQVFNENNNHLKYHQHGTGIVTCHLHLSCLSYNRAKVTQNEKIEEGFNNV